MNGALATAELALVLLVTRGAGPADHGADRKIDGHRLITAVPPQATGSCGMSSAAGGGGHVTVWVSARSSILGRMRTASWPGPG